jgi:hypothetical protein
MVERGSEREDAVTADPPPGRLEPGDPQAAEGKRIEPPVSLPSAPRHRPAATATPEPLEDTPVQWSVPPWIARRLELGMVLRKGALGHRQLAEQHRSGLAQARGHRRILGGHPSPSTFIPASVAIAGGVDQVLERDRYPVKRPSPRRDIGFTGSAFLQLFNGVDLAIIVIGATHLRGSSFRSGPASSLPGTLQFGAFSPWLFPLFGLLVLVVALPFARVAAHFPVSGGPVVYAAAFGPPPPSRRAGSIMSRGPPRSPPTPMCWSPISPSSGRRSADGAAGAAIIARRRGAHRVNVVGVRRAVRLLDALTLLKARR